ncbi:hypothetical protein [Ideonella sp.]|uniref:hypothetical protein n=1 Tax=Ideonella sp. TaxID=1929293 RepID=UPI003BB4BEE0
MQTSFAIRSARRTAQALTLASLAWLAVPAQSANLTSIAISDGIPVTSNSFKGDVFYKSTFAFYYAGGKVILSGNQDGTGTTYVDDVLFLKVTHPDGSFTTVTKNYHNETCNIGKQLDPVDLASKFQPGLNIVNVEMRNKCGGSAAAQRLWLSTF